MRHDPAPQAPCEKQCQGAEAIRCCLAFLAAEARRLKLAEVACMIEVAALAAEDRVGDAAAIPPAFRCFEHANWHHKFGIER